MYIKTILILLLCSQQALSWHPTGHFIVARIAEIELAKGEPEIYAKLNSILGILSDYTKEENHPFVEAATFSDDIKYQNWKSFNKWHFNDIQIYDHGMAGTHIKAPHSEDNIVWSINEAKNTLRNVKYSKINDLLGKSFELRYLIHLIGDVHQPLHNASLFSAKFPHGDMGGNKFSIKLSGVDNLHLLWDKCLKHYRDIHAPLNDHDWEYLNQIVEGIMNTNTRDNLSGFLTGQKSESVAQWSLESNHIAHQIYNEMTPGQVITQECLDSRKAVIDQQLALGGYRLTDTIISLFKDNMDRLESHKQDINVDDADLHNETENKHATHAPHKNHKIIVDTPVIGVPGPHTRSHTEMFNGSHQIAAYHDDKIINAKINKQYMNSGVITRNQFQQLSNNIKTEHGYKKNDEDMEMM